MPWIGCYPRILIATCETLSFFRSYQTKYTSRQFGRRLKKDNSSSNMRRCDFFHIFLGGVYQKLRAVGCGCRCSRHIWNAPSKRAPLKLDAIFIARKIRIFFVCSLVSAFSRVIHVQWCVPCTILQPYISAFYISKGMSCRKWNRINEEKQNE